MIFSGGVEFDEYEYDKLVMLEDYLQKHHPHEVVPSYFNHSEKLKYL